MTVKRGMATYCPCPKKEIVVFNNEADVLFEQTECIKCKKEIWLHHRTSQPETLPKECFKLKEIELSYERIVK